jgi:hypothetical protein
MVVALALAVGISTAEAERRPCALALALTVYAAVDLNGDASNFTAFPQASPELFTVVEFFAHWSAPRL